MKVTSLSVVVPSRKCINDCRCCVSKMHEQALQYGDITETINNKRPMGMPWRYQREFLKRLEFARDNDCNTVLLTGSAEPHQNRQFLDDFGWFLENMEKPFRWVEIQTTGALLDDEMLVKLEEIGVNTIALSLFSFDDYENADARGVPDNPRMLVDVESFCREVKRRGFNLRLCLNLSDYFVKFCDSKIDRLFAKCRELAADQVTLRKLYKDDSAMEQSVWVAKHSPSEEWLWKLNVYLSKYRILRCLETGHAIKNVDELGVVYDDDCMALDSNKKDLRYLILRPNGKLYSDWSTKASLVF